MGVSLRAVQLWEGGANYPTARALESLITVLFESGGLRVGHEATEIEALWAAAVRDGPRARPPLDLLWLAGLLDKPSAAPTDELVVGALADTRAPEKVHDARARQRDWGDAPDVRGFVGRGAETAELGRWVINDRCRVLALLGLGGIGKTILAARLAQDVAADFELVYWRSLRSAPSADEWLGSAIGFLSDHELPPPEGRFARRRLLLELLRQRRCLLVLDNLETVLASGDRAASLPQDADDFGSLIELLAESSHQSCLLLTSREAPPELGQLSGDTGAVRAFTLDGLSVAEAQALLEGREVWGDDAAWANLVATYAGNSLALKVTSETIQQVFGGDIAAFIAYVRETYGTAVRGIRRLMDAQIERRLSQLELAILRWLAVEREPTTFSELALDLGPSVGRGAILEALESLRRRSLVESSDRTKAFSLQSVVLEYVTDRLVEEAADEIVDDQVHVLRMYPLVKALAKDYVRRSQERLSAQPLLERLKLAGDGRGAGVEHQLLALLDGWRKRPKAEQGYGPGNVVNLLRLLRGNLHEVDLSHLFIRQAFLQGVEAQDASLAEAQLAEVVLAEPFEPILSVALAAAGQVVAVGTMGGEVRLWRTEDRTPLVSVRGHTGSVYRVALSADGKLLVSGAVDGRVRIWDGHSGAELATFDGHAGGVYGVALSADGRLLASGGQDGRIRLWDPASGRCMQVLETDGGTIYCVALSGDGRILANGSLDGTIRLWDAANGQCVSVLHADAGVIRGVALSGDGKVVAAGGHDGTIRLWDSGTSASVRVIRPDRLYQRLDVTGLSGVTDVQRAALLALGAVERVVQAPSAFSPSLR